ncbi:MAG: cupredoxin domain-containing protein [Gemmatimonadota bacterium]
MARSSSWLVIVVAGMVAGAAMVVPRQVEAQPVTERSPNLEGTWVTSQRNLHFTFSHRFEVVGGDVDVSDIFGDAKIVNYPTFAFTYGLLDDVNLGFRYSSNSTIAGGPNEWQPYVKWAPLRASGGRDVSVAATAAWNGAAESLDGEVGAQADLGRLGLLGAVRGFTDAFDPATGSAEGGLAVGGGALVRLTRHVSLAADVAETVAGPDGETAWSAGLQVGIPYTPHTLSLLATNVTSGTLQGASRGAPGAVYWGFEFTVPFSGIARWGDVLEPMDREGRPPRGGVDETGRAVVEIDVANFSYGGDEMRIPAGTTVRWVNRDPVGHTVTPDDGNWGSPLIGPGEVFEHTFSEPGRYPYHCIPHPYMESSVVVSADEAGQGDASTPGG